MWVGCVIVRNFASNHEGIASIVKAEIVEGETEEYCRFKYVLRKADVSIGDTVISSGLDGLFPKGLRIGSVEGISRNSSGIFQEVKVRPFVDFARLEEVLVMLD